MKSTKLIPIANHTIKKERKGIEYEIKLDAAHTTKTLPELLATVEQALSSTSRYVTDKVQIPNEMTTHFMIDKNTEYSIFRYQGNVMLKIKKHHILDTHTFPIFKNSENFIYENAKIIDRLSPKNVTYVGSMLKRRLKDFVVDSHDGRVYALAVTICDAAGHSQHQLEVEYHGYLAGQEKINKEDEPEILQRLTELANFIYTTCKNQFVPSTSRKYELVAEHGAVENAIAAQTKSELLNNLEGIQGS